MAHENQGARRRYSGLFRQCGLVNRHATDPTRPLGHDMDKGMTRIIREPYQS